MSEAAAIVLSTVGGRYFVHHEGEVLTASIRGRIKRPSEEKILVGDRVLISHHPDGSTTIEEIKPRRSLLRRRSPGKSTGVRAIAANLDQVIVVGALNRPAWDPHLMDRFIAVAEASDLPSVLVANKADLADDGPDPLQPYREAGYPTLVTSVPRNLGLDSLRVLLAGRISLFTGPSGVGKSSLLNQLEPGLKLRTAEVAVRAGTGRHTTVSAEMHPLGGTGGGFVVDTPGLRDIGLWGLAPADVAAAFPELPRFSGQCHFDNCRHLTEPGCAVVEAAGRGELSPTRLASYRKMLEEASVAARPWTQ